MSSVDQLFHDVFALSPEIKLKLIHELWDDLAANPTDVPIDESQIDEAERRIERLDRNPELGLTWEEVKRQVRAEHGR